MLSDGIQAADFIKVLHPTMQKAGLSYVGINCCDAMGWKAQQTRTAQLISAGVETLLSRITSHSYSSDPTSPMSATIPVWQTENADLSDKGTWETTWYSNGGQGEGFTWAQKIYTAITQGGVSAYLYWEGFEKDTTNSCLVITDGTNIIPSGRLWAFAQWSRFVRPGAVRVAVSGSTSTLNMTAFKNKDGTVSVQMINSASSATSVTVNGFSARSAQAYLTDNSHNNISGTTVSLSGGAATVNVPGHAMVTVVLS
jgi:O-glycosyl hydrolase